MQFVIKSIRKALPSCIEKIDSMAIKIEKNNDEQQHNLLIKCASTAVNSKLIHQQKEFFSKKVVDAVLLL